MPFIAGRYTLTWGSLSLGQTSDGIRLSHQLFKRLITGDAYAETKQDGVYRGTDMEAKATLIEYDAPAVRGAIWPYGNPLSVGIVGITDVGSGRAKPLVLTAVAGTPAVGKPASITLPLSILKEGFPVELLFAPDLREVPLSMRIYPNAQGIFGTQT